jgi:CTP-dependent riboflavin kinase
VEGYPADKLEVIAPLRLKEALAIEDGERVTIEFVD